MKAPTKKRYVDPPAKSFKPKDRAYDMAPMPEKNPNKKMPSRIIDPELAATIKRMNKTGKGRT